MREKENYIFSYPLLPYSIEAKELYILEVINPDINKEVFPVYRSPKINCLCPLPIGKRESTILRPVISESLTLALKAI